jgi:type IV pilus assembly protein PilY1
MNTPRNLAKKTLIGYLIYALGFSPLAGPAAHAASADFSNVPLPAKQRPNPNMILSIDDSGSMDGEIAVDGNDGAAWYYTAGLTVGSGLVDGRLRPGFHGLNQDDRQDNVKNPPNFNRAGLATGTWKKYVYLFPNGVCGANCDTRAYADASNDHFAISPSQQFGFYRSPDFNKQYYNPTIVYQPWKPYGAETAGERVCPSGTVSGSGATWLCTPGNADPRKARSHPIHGSTEVDLTKDIGSNINPGYYFRLYDGMRVLGGARYRRCTGAADGSGCEAWQTAPTGSLLCVGGDNANAKAVCDLGIATTGNILMTVGATQYDHVDMAPDYFPARYFISQTSTTVDPAKYTSFPEMAGAGPGGEKMYMVEIRPSTPTYPKAVSRTDCAGTVCTYDEEIQNFANWYQYYRKRHMSLNGAMGNAFDGVRALRAGYFLFNNRFDVKMYEFDAVGQFDKNERALLGKLYRVKGTGGTPTRESLRHMGDHRAVPVQRRVHHHRRLRHPGRPDRVRQRRQRPAGHQPLYQAVQRGSGDRHPRPVPRQLVRHPRRHGDVLLLDQPAPRPAGGPRLGRSERPQSGRRQEHQPAHEHLRAGARPVGNDLREPGVRAAERRSLHQRPELEHGEPARPAAQPDRDRRAVARDDQRPRADAEGRLAGGDA